MPRQTIALPHYAMHMCAHMHTHSYIRTLTHAHSLMRTHTHPHLCTLTHTHTHTLTHTHSLIQTHSHTPAHTVRTCLKVGPLKGVKSSNVTLCVVDTTRATLSTVLVLSLNCPPATKTFPVVPVTWCSEVVPVATYHLVRLPP